MTERVAGKAVAVFGAGSIGPGWGNGKAAAVLFAREGASVLCVDVNGDAAEETAAIIRGEGGTARAEIADVTDAMAASRALAHCGASFGGVDIVHYNVGISKPGGIAETTDADWARVFDVNLNGAFNVARAAIPLMQGKGGAFVFISSIASVTAGGYAYAGYEASKAALNRMSQTIAVAHAAEGIRSNVVMPGLIDTPHVTHMIAGKMTDAEDIGARRAKAPPMRRQGSAWDVAEASVFLGSDAAGYITGVALAVDGGLTLTVPSA